jgi:hypothetical protein
MRIPTSVGYAVSAAAAIALLAGCSGSGSQVAPLAGGSNNSQAISRSAPQVVHSTSVLPAGKQIVTKGHAKPFMRQPQPPQRLTYISDAALGAVDVFTRAGALQGTITGFSEPQGVTVDSNRNLWVANTTGAGSSGGNIEEFARGGTSPIATLSDNGNYPVDVAVCNNGTVYASNIFNLNTGIGSVSVYANGATSPTGTLQYPGQSTNYFITCDASGNVFTTLNLSSGPGVVEYPGGNQSGATAIITGGISFPGGIKGNNSGNLLVDDQNGHTVTEYTESGSPTGNSISTGSGDWVQIAVTRNSNVVAGADAAFDEGTAVLFPSGTHRQTYPGQGGQYIGIGFDPGQAGT